MIVATTVSVLAPESGASQLAFTRQPQLAVADKGRGRDVAELRGNKGLVMSKAAAVHGAGQALRTKDLQLSNLTTRAFQETGKV